MAVQGDAPTGDALELIHPVYLDVPMMVSFLAAVEGGVSFSQEFTERLSSATTREREGQGRAGVPSIASLFGLAFDMTGRLKRQSQDEESTEMKVIREHTEASLFNLLRETLRQRDDFFEILSAEQLQQVNPGFLVEVSGEILGNPLQQILDAIWQILPYLGIDPEQTESQRNPQRSARQSRQRSGRPSPQSAVVGSEPEDVLDASGLKLFRTMREDVGNAKVRDLILQSSGELRAVLTMAREFLTPANEEYLLGGRFTAIGKVTRVLEEGASINLTRRTAFGLASPEVARQIVNSVTSTEELAFEVADPIVEAPAVQILPLAVFV
jgi:hypothetical protein